MRAGYDADFDWATEEGGRESCAGHAEILLMGVCCMDFAGLFDRRAQLDGGAG